MFYTFAEKEFEKCYPAVYAHLLSHKAELSGRNRAETGVRYEWYALQRFGSEYSQEFEKPKIIVPAITDTVNFAPDLDGYYCNNKATIFVPDSVPFACAAANSQVAAWFAFQTFATKQGGFLDFEPRYSTQIPMPRVSAAQQRLIECLSEYLMYCYASSTNRLDGSVSSYFERLLNALIYELFFESDLHSQRLNFFSLLDAARPLSLASVPPPQRLARLAEFHAKISDLNHPIYSALFQLNGLDVVRIIEGKE